MTVKKPDLPPDGTDRWIDDDEIDLRGYVDVLVKWWREIVLFTVLAAVLAGGALYARAQLITAAYRAASTVAIARVASDARFDERFQTVDASADSNANSRRSSLLGLVKNGAIAQMVIDEMGADLAEMRRNPAKLLDSIDAEIVPGTDSRNPSDLIRITATAHDPNMAAAIANSWAAHYVAQINTLFGQVPNEVIAAVDRELVQSSINYDLAQAELESFIVNNPAMTLNRKLAERQALVDNIQSGRDAARHGLLDLLIDAQADSTLAILAEQIQQQVFTLDDLYTTRRLAQQYLSQANLIQDQLESGGDAAAATTALAIQLLKAQAFAAQLAAPAVQQPIPIATEQMQTTVPAIQLRNAELPAGLQVAISAAGDPQASAEEQMADVSALITALDDHIERLEGDIEALAESLRVGAEIDTVLSRAILERYTQLVDSETLLQLSAPATEGENDPMTLAIGQLEEEIRSLQAQLERETARELLLTQNRDLAWGAYETLSNRVLELNLERTAANSVVRLGAPAIPPVNPIKGLSLFMTTALAAAVGFLLAVFIAFFANFMGVEPFLRRRAG